MNAVRNVKGCFSQVMYLSTPTRAIPLAVSGPLHSSRNFVSMSGDTRSNFAAVCSFACDGMRVPNSPAREATGFPCRRGVSTMVHSILFSKIILGDTSESRCFRGWGGSPDVQVAYLVEVNAVCGASFFVCMELQCSKQKMQED